MILTRAKDRRYNSSMKEWAKAFYLSPAWRACRDAYAASVGGLCEQCYARGEFVPGVIVHHKVHLSPENINDPSVTLNWDNLELVCRDCHAIHHLRARRRYVVDELGRVTAPPSEKFF